MARTGHVPWGGWGRPALNFSVCLCIKLHVRICGRDWACFCKCVCVYACVYTVSISVCLVCGCVCAWVWQVFMSGLLCVKSNPVYDKNPHRP